MKINFISSNYTGITRTIYVWSDNEEIRQDNETNALLKNFLNLF